jgi:hypothetical protein
MNEEMQGIPQWFETPDRLTPGAGIPKSSRSDERATAGFCVRCIMSGASAIGSDTSPEPAPWG